MAWFQRGRRWGTVLLAVWLIVLNALPLLRVEAPWSGTAVAVLGLAAGILLLLER